MMMKRLTLGVEVDRTGCPTNTSYVRSLRSQDRDFAIWCASALICLPHAPHLPVAMGTRDRILRCTWSCALRTTEREVDLGRRADIFNPNVIAFLFRLIGLDHCCLNEASTFVLRQTMLLRSIVPHPVDSVLFTSSSRKPRINLYIYSCIIQWSYVEVLSSLSIQSAAACVLVD